MAAESLIFKASFLEASPNTVYMSLTDMNCFIGLFLSAKDSGKMQFLSRFPKNSSSVSEEEEEETVCCWVGNQVSVRRFFYKTDNL